MRSLIESKNSLYNIIENLCKEEGINIAELCRQAKIRPGLLSDLKSGRANSLTMDSLRKIANYFNIPMDVLFDREIKEDAT